jgi:hypothetical protein
VGFGDDSQAHEGMLGASTIVPDGRSEDHVTQGLEPVAELEGAGEIVVAHGLVHLDLLACGERAEAEKRPLSPEEIRLEKEVVVAVQHGGAGRQGTHQPRGLHEPLRVKGRLLDGHHTIDSHDALDGLGREVHPAERGLELEGNQRKARGFGNRVVVQGGNLRIQWFALVRGDGEDEQGVRSGPGGVGGKPAGLLGEGSRQPGDHESPATHFFNHDLKDPQAFLREQVRPLARVHVHGQPAKTLANEPVNVSPE